MVITSEQIGAPRKKPMGAIEPAPPAFHQNATSHGVAFVMAFNGQHFRSVLDIEEGGTVKPGQVVAMLRGMADMVEKAA